jgi:hypothetical protein
MTKTHHTYADYYYATAGEVFEHDGVRLLPDPSRGRTVPIDLCVPLVVTATERLGDLVSLTVIDRGSMVHEALGNLPEGVVDTVETLVFEADEKILLRY